MYSFAIDDIICILSKSFSRDLSSFFFWFKGSTFGFVIDVYFTLT